MEGNQKEKKNLLIGIILGLLVGVPATCFFFSNIESLYDFIFPIIVSSILITILIFISLFLLKNRILSFIVTQIRNIVIPITKELSKGMASLSKGNISNSEQHLYNAFIIYFNWFTWQQFRRWFLGITITLITALAGYFGSILFIQQNEIIQNQLNLDEANRRSSFIFLMSNIMDKIDEEAKNKTTNTLSKGLIGRIAALSNSLKPYKYLDHNNNELIKLPTSPERGHLLIALLNNQLDTSTYRNIFDKGNFKHSDLKDVNMQGLFLDKINLSKSDLSKANLDTTNFIGGHYIDVNLTGAKLENCTFKGSSLNRANLSGANLTNSTFQQKTTLKGANLKNAYLQNITIDSGVILDSAIVNRDWFKRLEGFNVKNVDSLKNHYTIENNNNTFMLKKIKS